MYNKSNEVSSMYLYNVCIIILTKIITFFVRLLGKQGGALPGVIAMKLNKNIIKQFRFPGDVIVVTGTNGKTTTTNWIAHTFETAGYQVVSNKAGNNIGRGIVGTLINNCTITGKVRGDITILEVDEHWVPVLFKTLPLDTFVVLNFFRDQLDRAGEMKTLIEKLSNFLKDYNGNLVLNGNDPNVCSLALANPDNQNIYYFGVDQYENSVSDMKEASEGRFCPVCKAKLEYDFYQYSHIGSFHCPNHDFGNVPYKKLATTLNVTKGTFKVGKTTYQIGYQNIVYIYNAMAVITTAHLYKLSTKNVKCALKNFKIDNGRLEEVKVGSSNCIINLVKNPTGLNVTIKIMNEEIQKKELLFVLNDKVNDGFDVSWIWDVNFEDLKNVNRVICSGLRAYDAAIRIKCAGIDPKQIEVYPDLREAVDHLFETSSKKYVVANYSAIQNVRHEINRKAGE